MTQASGLPNFFLVGAARAGTTSLYHYLAQHPDVYMSPVKEPRFFAFENRPPDFRGPGDERQREQAITTLAAYRRLFAGVRGEHAVGEASVVYLPHRGSAAAIARRVPSARIVALLRDPAERAYSAYLFHRRDCLEPCATFEEALDAEPQRMREGWYYSWHYRSQGFYHRNLQQFYDAFDPTQVRVYLTDDLESDPHSLVADVFRFLGVDDGFRPDVRRRHNRSGAPRSARLQRAIRAGSPLKDAVGLVVPEEWSHRIISPVLRANLERPPLADDTRAGLAAGYADDLARLEARIGRDLSAWHA